MHTSFPSRAWEREGIGLLLLVLENLVQTAYSRDKHNPLARANLQLEINRHLWRLALEFQVIPLKRYEHGSLRGTI